MQVQKLKSLLLFVILSGVLFYAAHQFTRETEVDFVVDNARSSYFLTIVERLDEIQFDFTESLGSDALLTPVSVPESSLSHTSRENPFKQSSSSSLADSFGVGSGFLQEEYEEYVDPDSAAALLPQEQFIEDAASFEEEIPSESVPFENIPSEDGVTGGVADDGVASEVVSDSATLTRP